jgi:hypothetical protein
VAAVSRQTLNGKWSGGSEGVITIRPEGGQPPAGLSAGLSAARGMAALRAYFVFSISVTIDCSTIDYTITVM